MQATPGEMKSFKSSADKMALMLRLSFQEDSREKKSNHEK